jgi:Domain of unknown function (DUF6249)
MNKHSLIALMFSGLLALTSLYTSAEELIGTVVSPKQQSEIGSSSSSSIAPVDMEKVGEMFEQQMDTVFEHPAAPVQPRWEESHQSDFNELILIPIISVVVIFGGGFFCIITLMRLRYKAKADRRLQRQDQIQRFIDAGRDVPNELLRDVDSLLEEEANLAKGVKDTLIGLAIVVFLTVLVGFDIGAAGLIIVAVGLSRIIIWKISQSKKSSNN